MSRELDLDCNVANLCCEFIDSVGQPMAEVSRRRTNGIGSPAWARKSLLSPARFPCKAGVMLGTKRVALSHKTVTGKGTKNAFNAQIDI